jgi:hypothetical protein
MPSNADVQTSILASLQAELSDLQPTLSNMTAIAGLLADLSHLSTLVAADAAQPVPLASIIADVQSIQNGTKPNAAPNAAPEVATMSDFGPVLEHLYLLQAQLQVWVTQQSTLTEGDQTSILALVANTISQVRSLLDYRPDVGAVMDDLAAVKTLMGGPADATAYHDFNVLQIATRDVWIHLFDNDLKSAAGQLYDQANQLYQENSQEMPDPGEITDINQLNDFISGLASVTGVVVPPTTSVGMGSGAFSLPNPFVAPATVNGQSSALSAPPPAGVLQFFPNAGPVWSLLSNAQQSTLIDNAQDLTNNIGNLGNGVVTIYSVAQLQATYTSQAKDIVAQPQGTAGRLAQLMIQLAQAQCEPYAFDVFAPNSFNFGLVITYRQIWQPGPYQAGDLVSTIPLAPGESRKYTHRRVVKESVSRKTAEKSTQMRSQQSSEDSRAERDIMDKATSATNFQLTTHGGFNLGIGSMDVTSQFGGNTSSDSTQNKKDFHEATLKAAEEYRQERSLEVDTNSSVESEDITSGEISNPNNEITVTYLFYELQRRYTIREFLYQVQPVIMIAQDVPSPEQINEAWLLQYQWILARVLLDDSLKPALNYLSTGYAGDQFSTAVLQAQWKTQESLVQQLEILVQQQMMSRDSLRNTLMETQENLDSMPEIPGMPNLSIFGYSPDVDRKELKAQTKAGETRLKYVEQALADAQDKLRSAASTYQQATKDYAAALQNQYSRQIAIDQLRIHVKQNIFYYMQAIWAHEDSDQRYFRLYRQQVMCPDPQDTCTMSTVPVSAINQRVSPLLTMPVKAASQMVNAAQTVPVKAVNRLATPSAITTRASAGSTTAANSIPVNFWNTCVPGLDGTGGLSTTTVDLASIADIDTPIGYKGNYILFPLTSSCALTNYMLSEYIDSNYGVSDPDGSGAFDPEQFDDQWQAALAAGDQATLTQLQNYLKAHIEEINNESDEIIVPTGQLFIEALPGSHPLLEDFKLLHREADVASVLAQNRHAELENLRLASRLVANPQLLQDPRTDKRIVVDQGVGVVMDSNP